MEITFLDFEQPLADLQQQLDDVNKIGEQQGIDVSVVRNELIEKINQARKDIYTNITPWQKVQLSRHPNRPYTNYYLENICSEFAELHGDRLFGDDKAIVGGFGIIDKESYMIIGHQKGSNTKMRQYRNFGMANPEGYRKALRLMKLAEKFNKPIVTFIDTPGAYPGLEAEERGQAEAIAKNIIEMVQLNVPVLNIVIGEGASGGALGIGVGDKTLMLEHTWYSVISPESCSSILWRNWEYKEQAAEALKLTPKDMKKLGLIDAIVKEPIGGAHAEPEQMASLLKKTIKKQISELSKLTAEERIDQRIKKYESFGQFDVSKIEKIVEA